MGEPPDLWETRLPEKFRDRAPRFPHVALYESNHHLRGGCWDPHDRLADLAIDGISAEVLFPTLGVQSWLVDDPELERACIRVYNDWMIEFCNVAPERYWGLAMISLWDIDEAVKELDRCHNAGLRGASIWLVPPAELPYASDHYERFWDAAQSLEMPVNMHINARATPRKPNPGEEKLRQMHSVNGHKIDAMNALGQIIGSGVLERYPRLKVAVAETGVGWIPFWLQEFDYYSNRANTRHLLPAPPSTYFRRQVYATFISDGVGAQLVSDFGKDNFMWSNDYPHPACIWPDSTIVIEEDLGHLAPDVRTRIICDNAAGLYNRGKLPPPADEPGDRGEIERWLEGHQDFGASSRLKLAPF
jgi:predicted TIM-barrel fold metal-dependent hydrolase